MKTLKAQPLTHEAFHKYGDFANMVPEVFYDQYLDLCRMDFGRPYQDVTFSVLLSKYDGSGEMIAEMAEYHSWTGQGTMPIDGDVIMYVARPTTGDCPLDEFEAFYVPMGTMVSFNPGVWHATPLAINKEVHNLLVFPRRTWVNDVFFYNFTDEEKIKIEL